MFTHLKHLRLSLCLMLIGTSFLLLSGCSTPPQKDAHSTNRLASDTVCYSHYPANSSNQPNLITQYGDSSINQIKVLDMKTDWHGYRYWAAVAPYPDYKARFEDPCVAASNDLENWDTFHVPESTKPVKESRYNSCVSIVKSPNTDSIELWWRQVDKDDDQQAEQIVRISSTDGITWSNPEVVLESNDRSIQSWYSPSVIKSNGSYQMWYVSKRKLWLIESSDCSKWSEPICCNLDVQDGSVIWNIDISQSDHGYEIISSNYAKDATNHDEMSLYHATSEDGINWSREKKVLSPENTSDAWDNKGLYCGSFVEDDFGYSMIYSGHDDNNHKGLGLTRFRTFQKTTPINLESSYGDAEGYHPSIVSFDEPWNGYQYWCAFSPYPHADDEKENPHILASDDCVAWNTPDDYANPLDPTPSNYEKGVIYNSDPVLFFNEDSSQLECWWRFVDDKSDTVQLKRRCTSNGRDWSDVEIVLQAKRSELDYISFAVIRDSGKYKVWSIGLDRSLQYCETSDLQNWSEVQTAQLTYPSDALKSWHIGVNKKPGTDCYEMVICANDSSTDAKRRHMSLYETSSADGIAWNQCSLLLTPDDCGVDAVRGLYKSCFAYTPEGRELLFSYIENDETRGVGLTSLEEQDDI